MRRGSSLRSQRERREKLREQAEFWQQQATMHAVTTARIGRLQEAMSRAGEQIDAEFDRWMQ